MSGKKGQRSRKPAALPRSYRNFDLPALDGRTRAAIAHKTRVAELCSQLGGEDLSPVERALIDRFAFLSLHAETAEAAFLSGEKFDLQKYLNAVNSLNGLAKTLGLKRRPKQVSLNEVLEGTADEKTD